MVDLHRPKVDRGNEKDLAFVWELWLSGYCTGIPVTDPRLNYFDSLAEASLSHSLSTFSPV